MNYSLLSKYRSELMGVAMLWVMLFHAWDLDLRVSLLNWARGAGFGGVDIFIVLSAVGLVMSLSKKEQEYTAFLSRRAGRVLPAYFVVMVVYTLFLIGQGRANWGTLIWNSSLLYYWVRPAGAFNWYVAGIMLFYAITPFCVSRLKKSRRPMFWVGAAIAAGLLACRVLIQEGYWSYLDVFYRIPVLFLGFMVGFFVVEKKRVTGSHALFWLVWLGVGMAYLWLMGRVDGDVFYLPLCHLFLFTTVPMCFALCLCFEKLPLGWVWRFLRLVGEHSLEIYLLNVSLFAERELLQSFLDFGPGHYIYYLITFTLNILLGVILHRAVEWGRGRVAGRVRPA